MGCGILFVLAIGQLCVPRRSEANVLLCLLFFACFVWLAHGIGFKLGMLDIYPHLNKLHVPFLAVTGPLWYLYVRVLIKRGGWTAADRRHLIPASLSVLLLLPFLVQSTQYKQAYVEIDVSDFAALSIYVATRIAEIATIVYLAFAMRELSLAKARKESTPHAHHYSILFFLSAVALIAALARMWGSIAGNHTVSVLLPSAIILAAFIGFYCLSQRHPWLMTLGIRVARVRPMTDEGKHSLNAYRECLRLNRWHLNPDLKIHQLARKLGVPVHELSELINRESGGNFNSFINGLRVEHAKKLLQNNADQTMLEIAHASGFNSESAFYTQFKRFESVPPATYRRRTHEQALSDDT